MAKSKGRRFRFPSKISPRPVEQSIPRHRGALFIEGVPISTRTAFKAACAMQETSMRDAIITLMREYAHQAKI